jgi:ABC-type multidrug transport system fused ATPase/permease subunit
LTSRVDSNPQSVFELMGFNVGLIFIAILNVLACSILGIAHSWKLGLVIVFGGLPPLLAAGWLKIRLDMKLDHSVSKKNSTSASIASEAITAIRTVSSLAIEERVLDRYTAELDHAVSGAVRPLAGVMVCFALTQSIEYWFMALGFWYVFSGGDRIQLVVEPNLRYLGTAAAWLPSTRHPCTTSLLPSWPSSSRAKLPHRCSNSRLVGIPLFPKLDMKD